MRLKLLLPRTTTWCVSRNV